MKRLIVTMHVEDDTTNQELATAIEGVFPESDPTVWSFEQFFDDVEDGVVGRDHDDTLSPF